MAATQDTTPAAQVRLTAVTQRFSKQHRVYKNHPPPATPHRRNPSRLPLAKRAPPWVARLAEPWLYPISWHRRLACAYPFFFQWWHSSPSCVLQPLLLLASIRKSGSAVLPTSNGGRCSPDPRLTDQLTIHHITVRPPSRQQHRRARPDDRTPEPNTEPQTHSRRRSTRRTTHRQKSASHGYSRSRRQRTPASARPFQQMRAPRARFQTSTSATASPKILKPSGKSATQ